jgi:hypothetical protein
MVEMPSGAFAKFVAGEELMDTPPLAIGPYTVAVVGARNHVVVVMVDEGTFMRMSRDVGAGPSIEQWRESVRRIDKQASTDEFVRELRRELGVEAVEDSSSRRSIGGHELVRVGASQYVVGPSKMEVVIPERPFVLYVASGFTLSPTRSDQTEGVMVGTVRHLVYVEEESGVVTRLAR